MPDKRPAKQRPAPEREDSGPRRSGHGRTCPYMGLGHDPETTHLQPNAAHRCYAVDPDLPITLGHQTAYCYGRYTSCEHFIPLTEAGRKSPPLPMQNGAAIGLDAADRPRTRDPGGSAVGASSVGAASVGPGTGPDNGAKADAAKRPQATTQATNGQSGGKSGSESSAEKVAAREVADPPPSEPREARSRSLTTTRPEATSGLVPRLRRHFANLSFEGWTVYTVGATLLIIFAWFAFLGSKALNNEPESTSPEMQARIAQLLATDTPTATPLPTSTQKPTRRPEELPRETPPIPSPPPGGQVSALTPSEREVASVNSSDRLPEFGQRDLHVGQFNQDTYLGMLSIPLSKIANATRVDSAQLELVGLSDLNLDVPGEWTVELLPSQVDEQWSNLSYDLLHMAPTLQPPIAWTVSSEDMRPGGVNVMNFDDAALEQLRARLDSDRPRISFRITGPELTGEHEDKDNIFTWDTGYGEGFGTRPILRVAYVAPTPTPAPRPGAQTTATPLPLILWDANPTPAPTVTPMPAAAPGVLSGMVLFLTDRFNEASLMVYEPATGRTGRVTQSWVYAVARAADQSVDGVSVGTFARPCGDGSSSCTQVVVRRPGGQETEITEPGAMHFDPAFSPDGAWVAYTSNVTGNDEIFKVRTDGTENTRMTDNVWEWDKHASWSPDGSEIVFWSNRDGRKQIYIMAADGSDQRNVSNNPYNDWDPVWVK